jgi:hypothetical protein
VNVRRPILITGSHRSGTTWVGTLLGQAGNVANIVEPMNPINRLSWLGTPPRRWFLHIDDTTADQHLTAFQRIIALHPPLRTHLRTVRSARHLAANVRELGRVVRWRAGHAVPVIKDPIAFFSAEWLARTFDMEVVVLVRHPAAFASSLKRHGWSFDFTNFTAQPRLVATYLEPFADEIAAASVRPPDLIDQAILLWRCINAVALRFRNEHPEWHVVRYEDVAADPVSHAKALYDATDLPWSARSERRVRSLCSAENPAEVTTVHRHDVRRDSAAAVWTWQHRLSPEETARVRSGTADIATFFYGAEDWARASAVNGRRGSAIET